MSVPSVKLSEVSQINPRLGARLADDALVSFIGMADVDAESGTTSRGEERRFDEVAKGYTQFENGDLLVAKITPCFENGKIAQVKIDHPHGSGSTEFHVIRPDRSKFDDRFLLRFLRQPYVRLVGERRMTGSGGQRRVPKVYLADLNVPLLPLEEQRRVAQLLDCVDALRVRRREAIDSLDELIDSIFHDMFGHPIANPFNFSVSTVCQVAEKVTDGEHLTPKRESDGFKLLSARNVREGSLDFSNVDFIGIEELERIRKRCDPRRGDVLISCSGTIGRVAPVETDEPFALVRSVALIRPKVELITTEYLSGYLRTSALKMRMLQRAKSSSQANLFQGSIRELPVLLPPLEMQLDFGQRVKAASAVKAAHRAHLEELDALFASLQHRAFRGKLWAGGSAT